MSLHKEREIEQFLSEAGYDVYPPVTQGAFGWMCYVFTHRKSNLLRIGVMWDHGFKICDPSLVR